MELLPIEDPYATVWVAIYEPLIVEWLSKVALENLEGALIGRGQFVRNATGPTLSRVSRAGRPPLPAPEKAARREAIIKAFERPDLPAILAALKKEKIATTVSVEIHRELSPLGIAHFFRQLYFDAGAGVGPIEQVIAVAPKEQLEIIERRARRRTVETIEQHGLETTSESQREESVSDEISEHVQSSISRDVSVGVSAHAEGSVGVYSGGASMTADLAISTEQARELTKRRLHSQTLRTSEISRRTFTITVKSQESLSEEVDVRRRVKNDGDVPVNYALRRVMRKVRVKLQSMGPRLVWQLYVCAPGRNLSKGRLVMFREADPMSTPDLPPDAPPRPVGVDEGGTQTLSAIGGKVVLRFPKYSDRDLSSVIATEVMDAAPEGKDPDPPGALDGGVLDTAANPPTFTLRVDPGSADRIMVNYTAHYEPSASAIAAWQEKLEQARAAFEAQRLEEQFERSKRMINAKSRVLPRPSADLRDEERYEIFRRMIEEGFGTGTEGPAPVEIELFHRYFELSGTFYYVHPSWWRPRLMSAGQDYEITDESLPKPFGASLGWVLQLDGDRRRNEFLNSPWVRVCIPVRPGLERSACGWLAEHVEGKKGFDTSPTKPAGKLLQQLEERRTAEQLAQPGPDFVTLTGETAPRPARETWPVIDEFEILEPTSGFVYQAIQVA
jgi:hypothetical protein